MNTVHFIEDWKPYQQLIALRDHLLPLWVRTLNAGWKTEAEDEKAFAIFSEYRKSLAAVAENALVWGRDPAPCYRFADIDRQCDFPFFDELLQSLYAFLADCFEEVQVQWRFSGGGGAKGVHPGRVGLKRFITERGDKLFISPHYWKPILVLTDVQNLVADYGILLRRFGHHNDDERMQFEGAWADLITALRQLAVEAKLFGLDTNSIYTFINFSKPGATREDYLDQMMKLIDWLRQCEDQFEAEYQKQTAVNGFPPDALYPVRRFVLNVQNPQEQKPTRTPKPQKRRTRQRTPSARQLEAMKVVGECDGNFSEAARILKLDRKTVIQHYKAGLKNAGKLAAKLIGKPKIEAAPTDERDQLDIADKDDGPAASPYKPKGAAGSRGKLHRRAG